jgi:hypothetical protein
MRKDLNAECGFEIITTPVKFVALVFFEEFNWAGEDTRKITEKKF